MSRSRLSRTLLRCFLSRLLASRSRLARLLGVWSRLARFFASRLPRLSRLLLLTLRSRLPRLLTLRSLLPRLLTLQSRLPLLSRRAGSALLPLRLAGLASGLSAELRLPARL